MTPQGSAAISGALRDNGYFRRSRFRFGRAAGHKEWLHFAAHASGLDVLANFSLVDDVRSGVRSGSELARITCLVRDEHWDGDIDQYEDSDVHVRGGHFDVRFGENYVRLCGDVIELRARLRRRPIDIELTLRPVVMPNQTNTLYVDGCPAVHWIAVPRLLATGRIVVGDRTYVVENALAYHDHNWGYWRWGEDFAWEWGYGVPENGDSPWTLIYVRLTDRKHVTDLTQSVFLWRGARQHRFFRADEVTVEHEGLFAQARPFKLPKVMALVSPGSVTDIPERLVVRARGDRDWLDFSFKAEDVAQVIIPNDDDLGVTAINEVSGTLDATGCVDGESVRITARSIFEFLSD